MKTLPKKVEKTLLSTAAFFAPIYAQAQLKITDLSEVTEKAKKGSDAVKDIATYVVAAVLGIGLIFVVYALATSNPKGKDYLIGWIIAVIVILIAGMII